MKKIYPVLNSLQSKTFLPPVLFIKRHFFRFQKLSILFLGLVFLSISNRSYGDVTLTTSPVAAGTISQGSNNNVLYIVKVDVTVSAVTINNLQFTFTGTHDANDLTTLSIYFNPTAPTIAGSVGGSNVAAATFAAPHAYSVGVSRAIAAGSSAYFIVAINLNSAATDNNTIKINGALNPVVFGFTTTPSIINNQTDVAGLQTIQAADVTLTTSTVVASNLSQGSSNNVLYVVKMDAAAEDVTVNNLQFTFTGTHDANDLTTLSIYFNPTAPTIAGSVGGSNVAAATFAAPHTYNVGVSRTIMAGSSAYFIIAVNINSAATDNNTIKINGAANPIVFGFTTAPNIINNQSDVAGLQTIQAADVTLTTTTIMASNVSQGSNNNVLYVVKMDAATEDVTVNNLQFTFTGTHDANDLTTLSIYFNPTAPTIAGSVGGSNVAAATFAAPHTYNVGVSRTITAGSSAYFIVAVNINSAATDNNTIKINGAVNPIIFGFTTAPNIINNQSDVAGLQTIQAADVTLTTTTIMASNVSQGSNNNVLYVVKMDAAAEDITVNNLQFTFTGTHDANDLTTLSIYFNPTAPTIAGSVGGSNVAAATFAAPHTYNVGVSRTITAGSSAYFIVAVNINSAATDNNTIKINGAANPIVFGFTAAPNIINNQSDVAGLQTIQAADVALTTSTVAATSVGAGSSNNVLYVVKMDVATEDVTVNNLQFTFTGTHDANDLTTLNIYFNPTAPTIAGSVGGSNVAAATFAAPHTYNVGVSRTIAAGSSAYFIIAINISGSSTATAGNTIKLDGAINPVVFGFTAAPNSINNQTDVAGIKTIAGVLPVTFISLRAYQKQQGAGIEWQVASELNIEKYMVQRSGDGIIFNSIGETIAKGGNVTTITYSLPDINPLTGNNFYRIGAVNMDGKIEYSRVVKINLSKGIEGISVYPNPIVKNGLFNLQLQNLPKGVYNLTIYNVQGQRLRQQEVNHIGGSSVQQISLRGIAGGLYKIEVLNNGRKYVKTIMVE